jgi:transposase
VCVVDDAGGKATAFASTHTADGFDQLVARLRRYGDPAGLPVAIERPDGRLVDRLLEAGHPVVAVQPNAIKAGRDAEVVSGANHDPGDAALIAESLGLRSHRLRVLAPFSAETRALGAVVRTREDLVDQRVAATNQLGACLEAFWPGAKAILADLASPITLDFLTRSPTPESAASLGEQPMAGFLTKHGYCGRRRPDQLLARLRAAPAGLRGTVEVEAHRDAVLAMVKVLGALLAAPKDLDRSVLAHLGEHPDAEIFTSLPRSGRINAAQVLAEWGDRRPASADAEAVACLAGATPVTNQSAKHTAGQFRWACDKRPPRAICTFADNSRHGSPWAAKV